MKKWMFLFLFSVLVLGLVQVPSIAAASQIEAAADDAGLQDLPAMDAGRSCSCEVARSIDTVVPEPGALSISSFPPDSSST